MKTRKDKPAQRAMASGQTNALNPKTILVPLDYSEESRAALKLAVAWAVAFKASLRLLHVVEPPPYPEFGYAHMAVKEKQVMSAARRRMGQILEDDLLKTFRRKSGRVRYGKASLEIVAEAREAGADLIMLASHGPTGLLHWMMGRTAEQVVRHAHCPMMVVPVGQG